MFQQSIMLSEMAPFSFVVILSLALTGFSTRVDNTFLNGVSRSFNVVDYGAVGDGKTDDSKAFLKAWQVTCAASRNAILEIPKNKEFLLNHVRFEGPCKAASVHVWVLGNIVSGGRRNWKSTDTDKWIEFSYVDRLAVTGQGKLDGRGNEWWPCTKNLLDVNGCNAPTGLSFHACNGLQVSGLSLINSPRNHISINGVNNSHVSNLCLTAPDESPNTDGINIADSNHVVISDSFIGTGDDCIAINNLCSFINITNVDCGPGHGISVGSLGGSGDVVSVEEIHVKKCRFNGTQNGVRIKTWQGGSGYAKKITFEEITLYAVKNPIIIDQFYCNGDNDCRNHTSNVKVSDVTYKGVHGSTEIAEAITLSCSNTVPCTNIFMHDVRIQHIDPKQKTYASCNNAHGESSFTAPPVPCLH